MKYILKEMTKDEKPRAKMKKYGASSLTDYELLAIILKSGIKDKSVLDLALEITNYFSNITYLAEATLEELEKIKGLGEAKSLELLSCIELGKRIFKNKKEKNIIKSAKDAYLYVKYDLVNLKQEHFMCIYVNIKGEVLAKKLISIGDINNNLADYKAAVKWALKYSASGIIYVHNHPSGNPCPSDQDFKLTEIFENITSSVDIKYLDHIIVGDNAFFSFKKNQIIYL